MEKKTRIFFDILGYRTTIRSWLHNTRCKADTTPTPPLNIWKVISPSPFRSPPLTHRLERKPQKPCLAFSAPKQYHTNGANNQPPQRQHPSST